MEKILQADLLELQHSLGKIDFTQAKALFEAIQAHPHIFTFGKGRSGLVMDMFAMRLMQLGLRVHAIGEPTAPAVRPQDLLVLGSGSGRTEACLLAARTARSLQATVAAISAIPESPLAQLADILVVLPTATKDQGENEGNTMLAGTLFEQALLIFSDSVCKALADETGKTTPDLMTLHANIE